MSVSHSSSSSSSSATGTTSSFAPLPTGCAGLSGTHADGGFQGAFTLRVINPPFATCCSSVGSTPVFANNTCGCPFNSVFLVNDTHNFFSCTSKNNEDAGCIGPPNSASPSAHVRWSAVVLVLGVSLLVGAVGA
ncbi:hypothetical protein B0H10DRAFT_2222635 [Mycena sp. CBHHK59/15]|nr:hypothetical protein B0H10DRAFT_2222635 [Mycena sp. CBHHK59/15]